MIMFVADMSHRRRSTSQPSPSPSHGAGPSGTAPDLRREIEIVPKSVG